MLKGGCYCGAVRYEAGGASAEIDISTASLDDPGAVPPRDHTWTRSRLSWIRLADGLPEYRESRLSGNS